MNIQRIAILPIIAATFALVACGPSAKTPGTGTAPASSAVPAAGRAVEITANDTMKFNLTEIRAKAGEALSVTLKNLGTMPKFSMGHNWVLLQADTDVAEFTNAASTAAATDYLPAVFKNKIIATTKLLGPKEQDTVSFNAPKKAGAYPFICSFPGHLQVGMKGVLVVE